MNQKIEMQIEEHEERLKRAMLNSDIFELDKLLSNDLVFTNHLGTLISKQDDLNAHEAKMLTITEIDLSDQIIKIYENTAIISVKARILGSFDGKKSSGDFRFTRVWRKNRNTNWQIVAGHSSVIA